MLIKIFLMLIFIKMSWTENALLGTEIESETWSKYCTAPAKVSHQQHKLTGVMAAWTRPFDGVAVFTFGTLCSSC